MRQSVSSNYIHDYSTAIARLEDNPSNQKYKYQAVLALARMGSTDLAQIEYRRYELDKIRHHEDIMSLAGRLSKDLYLRSSGKQALEHARTSSEKYEAAFQDSGGYYSGINAATMALLANMPWDIVKDRVATILQLLPKRENLAPEDHYFIEATRAECLLLLGDSEPAKKALQNAIDFDPLNYTAHASTLKQFRLILEKRNADNSWLSPFQPPCPVHFAGHIWEYSSNLEHDLPERISDAIQSCDIGFGYGALAAGADIIIAEAMLREGAELNIILPTDTQSFIERSVRPFGEGWVTRFHDCIEHSTSVTHLPESSHSTFEARTSLAAQMSMGQAIMRGRTLQVKPLQLLANDPGLKNSLTLRHKLDWAETKFSTHDIILDHKIKAGHAYVPLEKVIPILLKTSDKDMVDSHEDMKSALNTIMASNADMHGLHFDLAGATDELTAMMRHNQKGNILVSEAVANIAALKLGNSFDIIFAGMVPVDNAKMIRCYNLKPIC